MKERPIYLNLFQFHFPITAWVSILHRISGVFLVLLIPILLWLLNSSLESAESFAAVKATLSSPVFKYFFWFLYSMIFYHLVAGVRHLLMDMHVGESKAGGRMGSYIVLLVSLIGILLGGYWICWG